MVEFDTPKVKPDVILPATFTVFAPGAKGKAPLATYEQTLWFFPRDPFATQVAHVCALDLSGAAPFSQAG